MKRVIVPAVLKESFVAIAEAVDSVRDLVPYVQIDVVDGVHASSVTWPFTDAVSSSTVRRLGNLRVSFELDLMVHRPEDTLDVWLSSGADRYIIHLSSTRDLSSCVERIRSFGSEVYVAVVIGDVLEDLSFIADRIDGVQCMGIASVGRQGEPYDSRAAGLVRSVRERYPSLPVSVDGAVSVHTVPVLLEAGASQFVVGSALFSGDVDSNFSALLSAVS